MEKITPTASTKYLTLNSKQEVLSTLQVCKVVESITFVNPQFKAWYCKAVKQLGPTKFLDLAAVAEAGRNPQTLFSWLLKQEMSRVA